jgi:non-specific serine/threonine protein kinase
VNWINRLERDLVNVREALEFMLTEDSGAALAMAAAVSPFWVSRGLLGEGRRWLDQALAAAAREPTAERVAALYYATLLAGLQGDPPSGAARGRELRALVEQVADPVAHTLADIADGFTALFGGDLSGACELLENAVGACADLTQLEALLVLGWAHELRGDLVQALAVNEKALALTESHGESVLRSYALWATGIAKWREGDRDTGAELLKRGLRLARELNDRRTAASCIEALAWMAGDADEPERAVVMLAAAESLGQAVRSSVVVFPKLLEHEAECERHARNALSAEEYDSARRKGSLMSFSEAVAYALAE